MLVPSVSKRTGDDGEGRVVRIRGSIVDVAFASGEPPMLHEGLEIDGAACPRLVLEVQQHLDRRTVRTVAMNVTSGLSRGQLVRRTGALLEVPVGDAVLGRLINVLGDPVDGKPAFAADVTRWPIHRPAPPFQEQAAKRTPFGTGIKVIDLLAPLVRGGKSGMFGGAGVGKTVLISRARFRLLHPEVIPTREHEFAAWEAEGEKALRVLEGHLAARAFLVDGRFTIADIALYAYTHCADEGGFRLEPYRAIQAWFARVKAQPGHLPIDRVPSRAAP